ncbi:MAG: hypothetical protein ACJAS1_002245 [Oleiphilaceae bacterium]|jgi:hypothetical protein
MNLKPLALAATLSIVSLTAFATPQYTGNTTATNITSSQMDTGYYIWNTESDTSNWHIRWTSTQAVPNSNRVDWFGSVVLEGNGLVSESTYSFDGSNDQWLVTSGLFSDQIQWTTITNDTGGIDGIDFEIDSTLEILEFNLGSSLFSNLAQHTYDPGVAGTNIYIGEDFATPDVLVFNSNAGVYQTFEVSVDEPATLALLGLGLAGLGFARRKQAKA